MCCKRVYVAVKRVDPHEPLCKFGAAAGSRAAMFRLATIQPRYSDCASEHLLVVRTQIEVLRTRDSYIAAHRCQIKQACSSTTVVPARLELQANHDQLRLVVVSGSMQC
jgi:hypothetical protein